MSVIFIFIAIILTPSLAVAETAPEDLKRFAGNYYNVSMNSRDTINLETDSTYIAELSMSLGVMGQSSGTWELVDPAMIKFNQSSGSGSLENGLESMLVIESTKDSKALISLLPVSKLQDHNESISKYGDSFYVYTKDRIERLELF
jgi:hypothetical protein